MAPSKKRTNIILLGTGTPNADPERSGPAVAIVVDKIPYIVDFGPGVVRRAAAAKIDVPHLNRAFLTHAHSDHTAGYPDLIFTPWVLGRSEPLHVYGPPGIGNMTEHLLAAFEQDITERLYGLEPANHTGYQVNTHIIDSSIIYKDSLLQVKAFPVRHGSLQAFGFKFFTPDGTIVISGDTAPFSTMVKECQGCHVLIHEVYSVKGLVGCPPDWQKYHMSVHTSSHELAHLAGQIHPDLVILYHQLFWGVSESQLLAEVKEIYDGAVVSGKDLDVY